MENTLKKDRELTPAQTAERSISKKYRKVIWNPFIAGVKRYALIAEGDRIASLVTGSAESLLLAVLMKMLVRYSDFPFEVLFFAPDNGSEERKKEITVSASYLGIEPVFFGEKDDGLLDFCRRAEEAGCGKAAVWDTADDASLSVVSSMLFEGTLRGLMPREKAPGGTDLSLIRPLYCVEGEPIAAWIRYNGIRTAAAPEPEDPRITETRVLLSRLKTDHPDLEKCIFNSLQSLHRDTFPGYILNGEAHSFLEDYEKRTGKEDG